MKIIRYIQSFGLAISCLFFSLSFVFTSCVDEEIIEREKEDKPTEEEPIDGYSIGFKIQLDKDMSGKTRGPEDYDNYIDTRDKFRVLFFTKEGQFLFGAIDRTVTPLSDQSGSGVATWYVRVPVNYIVDRDGNQFDADVIKKYLKENDFKVAILANWPNDAVMESDGGDDETTNTPEWTYIHREPNWGWKQSILNTESNAESNDVKNINDLHHLVVDAFYNDNSNLGNGSDGKTAQRPARREVYDFVMDGDVSSGKGTMGVKTDWVTNKIKTLTLEGNEDGRDAAARWIRTNWNPLTRLSVNEYIDPHYDNLWQLYDFNAACNSYETYGIYAYDSWGYQWFNVNGNELKNWLDKSNNTALTSTFKTKAGDFEFVPGNYTTDASSAAVANTQVGNSYVYNWGGNHGLVLKTTNYMEKTGDNYKLNTTSDKTKGYIKIRVPATGTLNIKFGSANGSNTKLYYQLNTTYQANSGNYNGNSKTDTRNLSVTRPGDDLYIFNGSANPAIIYSIEWISSKYLYDTDRIGVEPSEDNPIPMYGVQNFTKLGDNWEEGTTFDISAARDEEDIKPISLIRSLAKIEVYLPQPAARIYMRSMNRTSRCEPIDVETPTNELWSKDHTNGQCEWFDIQKYGSGFVDGTEVSNKTGLNEYTNWLSWFYYSWTQANWSQTPGQNKHWSFKDHNIYGYSGDTGLTSVTKQDVTTDLSNSKYPHLFYPDINRSDFCEMLPMGYEVGKGYKYILYMPEKNISDPNNPGKKTAIAKVPHIEYRYNDIKMSNYEQLEDDNCHRIYFTDYNGTYTTKNTEITTLKSDMYESVYEKNRKTDGKKDSSNDYIITGPSDNLSLHWPIMRNHIYEFIVNNSSEHGEPVIQAKVKEWGYDRVVVEW